MSSKRHRGAPAPQSSSSRPWAPIATLGLAIATVATAALVLKHFTGQSLPGCGPQSACGELERTIWGSVPGLRWPISFVGLAWFAGLLVGWLRPGARNAASRARAFVTPARVSALASLVFLTVMAVLGKLCWYCLTAHLANLLFVVAVHQLARAQRTAGMSVPWREVAVGFAAVTLVLAPLEWQKRSAAGKRAAQAAQETARAAEEQARASVDPAATERQATLPQTTPPQSTSPQSTEPSTPAAETPTDAPVRVDDSAAAASTSTEKPESAVLEPAAQEPVRTGAFTGRYRRGPERSPYRLVIFSDFQCRDCQRVEKEVERVLAQRKDITLSAKHFPMCTDCNSYMGSSNMHPNACWAARAVEAAGLLRGNEGYWQMYDWLFARGGTFVDSELNLALQELGYDPVEFQRVMKGDETLRRVRQDIEEAVDLGIHYTPLVFLNGVELRGWEVPGTVEKALLALDPTVPARTAEGDRPARAATKYVDDWRVQRPRIVAADAKPHWFGPGAAGKARVIVFGDYQSEYSARLDSLLQALMRSRPEVSYSLRHFPGDPTCNPKLTQTFSPQGCVAARAVEAAALVGGEEGYRKMHAWLFENSPNFEQATVIQGAASLGLDRAAFARALDDPAVAAAVKEDVDVAARVGVTQLPQVFVNGKWVPRWMKKGERILETILDEAAK